MCKPLSNGHGSDGESWPTDGHDDAAVTPTQWHTLKEDSFRLQGSSKASGKKVQ